MARMEMDWILKKWGYVSHVYSFCFGKLAKILIMVYFLLFKFTWYLPFSVPLVFCVRQRHVVLIWGHFDPKTWKSPWRSPCKSSYFGENDCFYQLFLKKPCWPKHTALGRFSQNKMPFHSQNTQFWAACENNIDAIGNKTENSRVPSYRGSVTAI